MTLALWIVQVLLLGMLGISSVMKTFMTDKAKETLPWLTPLAAVNLVTIQLLAIVTIHITNLRKQKEQKSHESSTD